MKDAEVRNSQIDNRIIEITAIVKSVFAALQHLAKHFSVDGNTQSDGSFVNVTKLQPMYKLY